MTIEQRLDTFIKQIDIPNIAREVASRTDFILIDVQEKLDTYVNETYVSLELVKPCLDKNLRILEVGAGLCVFSLFLKSEGYKISALEPAAGGFDFFKVSKKILVDRMSNLRLDVIEKKADELTKHTGSKFDLIFSCNVLEHIPDLESALDGMLSVLAPDGIMIHSCPNYVVPYEPHFSIPVVKPLRKLSEFLFHRKIDLNRDVWQSLNFVTYFQIRRYATRNKLKLSFSKGTFQRALTRLDGDPIYRQRHAGTAVSIVYRLIVVTRLILIINKLPASVSTPMVFEIAHSTE